MIQLAYQKLAIDGSLQFSCIASAILSDFKIRPGRRLDRHVHHFRSRGHPVSPCIRRTPWRLSVTFTAYFSRSANIASIAFFRRWSQRQKALPTAPLIPSYLARPAGRAWTSTTLPVQQRSRRQPTYGGVRSPTALSKFEPLRLHSRDLFRYVSRLRQPGQTIHPCSR